jgi:hypothetical protein
MAAPVAARLTVVALAVCALAVCAVPRAARAQTHGHTAGMVHPASADSTAKGPGPTATTSAPAGQAAFAVIADVVRQLEADPATDWTRVDIERLRQHLIDMDEVMMRSSVRMTAVEGGARFTVRGAPKTAAAIQRMLTAHAGMLSAMPASSAMVGTAVVASVRARADGADFTVTAAIPQDARAVARIRGLGFAGLLTVGEHHAAHHLALARGDAMMAHQ